MDDAAIVNNLGQLGLTIYEARAYLALIGREACTATEVSRLSGLPRQRVYDVLESLLEKGLVTVRPGRVAKYGPMEPEEAVGHLLDVQRQQLDTLERHGSDIVKLLQPAYRAGRRNTDPLDYIEILREPRAIAARFNQLQARVRREILVFNRPPYATVPQENIAGLKLARQRKARGLYELSLFDDPEAAEGVQRFIAAGEEARFVPVLPLKLVIIDEAIVLFGMEDPVATGNDLTIMVVERPSLAIVLKAAFESYWDRGVSFEDARDLAAGRVAS